MSVLSDGALARLYPRYAGDTQPASLDLHLGDTLRYWPEWVRRNPRLDQSGLWRDVTLADDGWVLRPGLRYLAVTAERIAIPIDKAGQIGARSSWARDGLNILQGPAGWCDPGFQGYVVLELSVTGSELVLWPGAKVAQLILFELTEPAVRPYGHRSRTSKYQNQNTSEPTPSRTHLEVAP